MIYTDYTAYNLRSTFSTEPGELAGCLMCGGRLSRSVMEPSISVCADFKYRSLMVHHIYTHLFICELCQWWCIRERWVFFEVGYDWDYVIVGVAANDLPPDDRAEFQEKPWLKALSDPKVFYKAEEVPPKLISLLPPAA